MTKARDIPRCGGELLLRVLEQNEPIIAAAATDALPSDLLASLLKAGALERHTANRTAVIADDDGTRFVDLVWYPDRNAYGYFDAADGHVVLEPEAQAAFRVNLPWWLRRLVTCLDLCNATQPTEIVLDHAWEIGDLWITRHRKVPIVFARRLHLNATLEALQEALAKRRGRGGGLILTSSQTSLRMFIDNPSYPVMSIFDVLTNDAENFAIDRGLLTSPYVAAKKDRIVMEPLGLSPDGRRLVINGNVTIDFKTDIHIVIIQQLVNGYRAGKRFRASERSNAYGKADWSLLAD